MLRLAEANGESFFGELRTITENVYSSKRVVEIKPLRELQHVKGSSLTSFCFNALKAKRSGFLLKN